MIRYVLKRIVMLIPVVLCVAIVIFTIMFFCPGDPADIILGSNAKDAEIAALRDSLVLTSHTSSSWANSFMTPLSALISANPG